MQDLPFAAQQQQVNKFLAQTAKLGADLDRMQGTTRIIWDSTGPTANLSRYEFFEFVGSKNLPATNMDQNKFPPGEGMVIKEIAFEFDPAILPNAQTNPPLLRSTFDFFIGNNRVIKSMPLLSFAPIASLNNLAQQESRFLAVRLLTNIVIPPQIQFKLVLTLDQTYAPQSNIFCYVKGYGKLFNPRNNY